MSVPVFNWPVQANDTGDVSYLVRTAQFGDGYAQESGDGINSSQRKWSITYSGMLDKVQEVAAFLDERAGYKSFIWTDPTGRVGLYKARTYQQTPYARDVFRITTTFTEAFSV